MQTFLIELNIKYCFTWCICEIVIVIVSCECCLKKTKWKGTNTEWHLKINTFTKTEILNFNFVSVVFFSLSICFKWIYSILSRLLSSTRRSRWCRISRIKLMFYKKMISIGFVYALDLFEVNFVRKWELIFHVILHFYKLDKWDYLHEFLTIDKYMANRINVHKMKQQHHELFPDKSK